MSKHKKHANTRNSDATPDIRQSVVVDALEGDKARLEVAVGQTRDTSLAHLPEGVKEGDVLREVDGKLEVDEAETHKRHVEAQSHLDAVDVQSETASGEIDL